MASPDKIADEPVYGWDWTTTTHTARGSGMTAQHLAYELVDALGPGHVLPGKGLQGWSQSLTAHDSEGYKSGTVYFGGRDDVMVQSTSAAADKSRPRILDLGDVRTARVDTRVDTEADFDYLAEIMRESADIYGSLVTEWHSDVRGVSRGRTLMVGAPTSAIRVRLYEKWLESPGQYVDGVNRVEVQLRPPSKSKREVSGWSQAETFCASKATQDLAYRLGDVAAPKVSLNTSRGTPDLERTIAAMGRQYRKGVREWLERTDGDVGRVFDELGL